MTKSELKKAVSYQIFCRRTDKGISQPMLAYMLGVHERNVRRWESRDGLPSPVMLCRMAEIFDCTVDALLGRERDDQRVSGAPEEDAGRGDPHGGAGDPAV